MSSSFSESDEKDFIKMINQKQIWKDSTQKASDTISNSICIQPFRTISAYNLWINRNIVLTLNNEFIYISGANIIIENFTTHKQEIIPIKNDCEITSLFYQISSTNERFILISEKYSRQNPIKDNNTKVDKNISSGRIELINLDNKILPSRMVLDLAVYAQYDGFIFDSVIPPKSDYCFIIVQEYSSNNKNCQIFIWNYVNRAIVDIQNIPFFIDGVVCCPFNRNLLLFYEKGHVSIWNFNEVRKNISMEYEFYNNDYKKEKKEEENQEDIISNDIEEANSKISEASITKADFFSYNGKNGVFISFRNGFIELYEIIINEETHLNEYYLYLRLDLLSLFEPNWANLVIVTSRDNCKIPYLENFISFDNNVFSPNFSIEKPIINEKDNYIKNIIIKGKYIIMFLSKSNIFIILEFTEDEDKNIKLKVTTIDKIEHTLLVSSSVIINDKMTLMLLLNGEEAFPFYSRMKRVTNMNRSNELNQIEIHCHKYKINLVNNTPNFIYEEQILKNTNFVYEVKKLLLSETPKMLLLYGGKDQKVLYFYKQNIKGNEEDFNNLKMTEFGTSNFINYHTQFYKEKSRFEYLMSKTLEEVPIDITLSPLGKCFFVSYKDSGYLYSILGPEIKEVFKVGMYCRACTFSETGTYLAFSTGEYETEFNIQIYNMSTYEYEYIITEIPPPTKLCFIDNGRVLIAQFKDSSINLLGWKLSWDKRLVKNTINANREESDEIPEENKHVVLKITDFSGNIIDFVYDAILKFCLITSADKRVRVYKGTGGEKYWEFSSEVEYPVCLIIKKYDTIVFGTSKGSVRNCLWPIPNMRRDSSIDHPDYNEIFLHRGKILTMALSRDNTFLFTSSEDGSILVSCISAVENDVPITMSTFIYFNPQNVLPKRMYYEYEDIVYVTDAIYQSKVDALTKQKSAIQSKISEHISNKEKKLQENANILGKIRDDLTKKLTDQVQVVKDQENLKERETKNLKEKREMLIKSIKDKMNEEKKKHKIEKSNKQLETTKLINCIKIAKEKFNLRKREIEALRNKTTNNLVNSYEMMYKLYQDKKEEIEKMIKDRKEKFEKKCKETEEENEGKLRDLEKNYKLSLEAFEESRKEKDNEIMKKSKDNKNYDEKIAEWENHLDEIERNNRELMETYIFNTLKLNQMNQLLSENENKISMKEKLVKEKREVNDRLEQLRFVLEYQIKNLILEKTPIEEQIKNFETLHSDFYKRFNLLYAELLNISDLIENNQNCIKTYREELSCTKKRLYELKNLYKCIDVEMNSILKNKLESKKDIIHKIVKVYEDYLKNFNDGKSQQKMISPEIKLQTKNIEKEIYHQKNNVLKELVDKRNERRRINREKEQMMKDIRLDNQLLIQECSNIRENLEDITKNINDIEKKFNELKQSCENE